MASRNFRPSARETKPERRTPALVGTAIRHDETSVMKLKLAVTVLDVCEWNAKWPAERITTSP
jgi:hypothetical protein